MNKRLILVLSFCNKDKHLAMEMLTFLKEIGFNKAGRGKGRTIVLAHCRHSNVSGLSSLAKTMFETVEEFTPKDQHEHGWPQACNHQFVRVAEMMKPKGFPWFFLEADAVVLNVDFLDVLEQDYYHKAKPILGRFVQISDEGTKHVTGISVYPPDALSVIGRINVSGEAWDYQCRDRILPQAADTRYIQQIWQRPPFKTLLELKDIEPDARIFHQCKDGSLYKLLRQNRDGVKRQQNLLCVDDRELLTQMQEDNLNLHSLLKEVLDIREGTGRNPRIAIRALDKWINENKHFI